MRQKIKPFRCYPITSTFHSRAAQPLFLLNRSLDLHYLRIHAFEYIPSCWVRRRPYLFFSVTRCLKCDSIRLIQTSKVVPVYRLHVSLPRVFVVRGKARRVSALCDLAAGSDLLQRVDTLAFRIQSVLIDPLVFAQDRNGAGMR